ncbi:MAG TPA: hypothetical protein VM223_16980 [Planctomycetota bacterium]|nr:hypothetical protein [Planctomycetota bacterium]
MDTQKTFKHIHAVLDSMPYPGIAIFASGGVALCAEYKHLPKGLSPERAKALAVMIKQVWDLAEEAQDEYGTPNGVTMTDMIRSYWLRVADSRVCGSCGREIDEGETECPRCGSEYLMTAAGSEE